MDADSAMSCSIAASVGLRGIVREEIATPNPVRIAPFSSGRRRSRPRPSSPPIRYTVRELISMFPGSDSPVPRSAPTPGPGAAAPSSVILQILIDGVEAASAALRARCSCCHEHRRPGRRPADLLSRGHRPRVPWMFCRPLLAETRRRPCLPVEQAAGGRLASAPDLARLDLLVEVGAKTPIAGAVRRRGAHPPQRFDVAELPLRPAQVPPPPRHPPPDPTVLRRDPLRSRRISLGDRSELGAPSSGECRPVFSDLELAGT